MELIVSFAVQRYSWAAGSETLEVILFKSSSLFRFLREGFSHFLTQGYRLGYQDSGVGWEEKAGTQRLLCQHALSLPKGPPPSSVFVVPWFRHPLSCPENKFLVFF